MRAYIVSTIVGVFAVDENNRLLSAKAFPKDPRAAAEKLKLSEIEMLEEERFVRDVLGKKGFREFIFGYRKAGVKHVEPNSPAEQFVKDNVRKLAAEAKMFPNPADLNQFLTKQTI